MPFWKRNKDKSKGTAKAAKPSDKLCTSARQEPPEGEEASSSSSSTSSTSSTSIQQTPPPVSLPDTRAFYQDNLRVPTRMLQDPNAVFVKLPNIATFKDGTRFTDADMNDAFYSVHQIFDDERETSAILNEKWQKKLRLIPDAIARGADVSQADTRNGFNCLTTAAINGFTDAIKFYIGHPDPRLRLNPFWPDANGNVATIFLARNDLNATDGNVAMIHEMLDLTVQLMVPNAPEHEKRRAMQRLVDVRDGTNGDTLLRVACYYDNIALVRWLDTYFQCDYIGLGKLRSQDGIPAHSALSSAVQPATKKDFGCLQFLVLEKGLNVAEILPGSKDPLTAIERAGYTQDGKAMVRFLTKVRKNSVDLFNAIVGQIYLSQNPNVRDALTRFQGLQELFDMHNREYAGSMRDAIALAKQHFGATTNR